MNILFVSGELIAGDLAYRLKLEGNDVKLFVEHPEQKHCLDGFVDKTDDWKKELSWVGKEGLIVFDDVGYGKEQDALRKEGYRVFGGSEGGDRLEQDREFGQEILKSCGLNIETTMNFETPALASRYVEEHPGCYVVKQNNHQSALNYVGELENGEDVLSILEKYSAVGITDVSLQKKLAGVEVSVARFFNGKDWLGPVEISFEHKALFNDDIGPKTGEMGSLMFYDENPRNSLFEKILAPLQNHLQAIGFHGDIAVNSFVQEDHIFPIEFTARIGCPIVHLQGDMHLSPWHEFFSAVADGKNCNLKTQKGFGIVLTLALPPFPYKGVAEEFTSDGLEVFFREELSEDEWKRVHFEGVRQEGEHYFVTRSLGYTVFVTGNGDTVEAARIEALSLARKIVIPKIFYRTDIGKRFERESQLLLKQWGWLS